MNNSPYFLIIYIHIYKVCMCVYKRMHTYVVRACMYMYMYVYMHEGDKHAILLSHVDTYNCRWCLL